MRILPPPLIGAAGAILWAFPAGAVVHGFEAYAWREWAAVRIDEHAGLASSWDRSGGNTDYNHYEDPPGYRTGDEVVTVATIRGPGVVRRFWMPHQTATGAFPVRLFVDGESTPRLDTTSDQILGGALPAFPAPLVTTFAGGQVSYEPIPFADSLRIESENRSGAANRHYYQYTYVTYPPDESIVSWTTPTPPEVEQARLAVAASFDSVGQHPDGPCPSCPAAVGGLRSIAPGESSLLLDAVGPGVVRRLQIRFDTPDDAALDALRLRVTYDADAVPAIDVPLSTFFGAGHGRPPYRSLPIGTDSPGGYYCYWPLPFGAAVRIELHNSGPVAVEVDSTAAELADGPFPPDLGRLHAEHRWELRSGGQQRYTLVSAVGSGHYVGSLLFIEQDVDDLWILEGDDVITVDGTPLQGTGLEDATNGGYYYNWAGDPGPEPDGAQPTSAIRPLCGLLYANLGPDTPPSTRTDQYRWRIADRVAFRDSIRVETEAVGVVGARYESVALWYSRPVPAASTAPGHVPTRSDDGPRLEPVRPNPSRSDVVLAWTLPRAQRVRLEILDVTGRRVATPASGSWSAGRHQVSWMPPSAGVYFCRLVAGPVVRMRKIVATGP